MEPPDTAGHLALKLPQETVALTWSASECLRLDCMFPGLLNEMTEKKTFQSETTGDITFENKSELKCLNLILHTW